MFGESLDLSAVLNSLKRADAALSEFVAPLWPAVCGVVAWMEHGPQLFALTEAASAPGYYQLSCDGDSAAIIQEASADDAQRYRNYLERANVILLDSDFAYPATFAERLQGITAPRPIFFAPPEPMLQIVARYDGINLFYDRTPSTEPESPLAGLFSGNSVFTTGEMLDVPGEDSVHDRANAANNLLNDSQYQVEMRIKALLDPAGAELIQWSRREYGFQIVWRRQCNEYNTRVSEIDSPLSTGICLSGSRNFDGSALTRLLLENLLNSWEM